MDGPRRPTDQKVGGSSPFERTKSTFVQVKDTILAE
jgi:hypothetical protein